jgi:glycosyltransferase involved in cell wall biosynthesis
VNNGGFDMSASPLKILHLVISLEPGGMENGVVNLSNSLDPMEFDVHVCCLSLAGEFAARLTRPDRIHVLGKPPGFSWRATLALARLISQLQPRVLHTHNLGPLIYGSLASGFGLRCAMLHGEHSLLPPYDREPRRLRQRRWFYRACRRIHTVSSGSRDELVGLGYPPKKIIALLNGVDTDRFAPGSRADARERTGLPKTAFVLGMVGRFGPFKQHSLAIEAFNRISERWPDVNLLMVGDGGTERDRVQAQAKASPASSRIHFAGLQHDLPLYYRAMDLLLVPSHNEGMSNVVLEAMACGVPALTHALSGHTEVIRNGEDGHVADLGSAGRLREELEKVLSHPARLVEMGQAARKNVACRFSLQQMIRNYASLYHELADQHRAQAA